MGTLNLSHFKHLSDNSYAGLINYYMSDAGLEESNTYENYVFNAIGRYIDSGNLYHINTLLDVARNMGRIRITQRLTKGLTAHKFEKELKRFEGKANKTKLKNLRSNWQEKFFSNIEQETTQEKKAGKSWDQEAAILRLVKTAHNKGHVEELISQMHHAIAEIENRAVNHIATGTVRAA
jgi:hypothetical protein